MSTTVRDIIKGAMKKIGVLVIGREPTAAQAEDALVILQDLYREFVGQGVFGPLVPTIVTASTYTAHENERVVCDNASGVTVTLPETITQEWCPAQGNIGAPYDYGWARFSGSAYPRQPRDNAIITITDMLSTFEKIYLYDAPTARWVLISDLALSDAAPLAGRYANALKAMVAVRLAAPFGVELSPQLTGEVNLGRYQLSTRFDRSARRVSGEYM